MIPTTRATVPQTPVTVPVKISAAMANAITILMTRSAVPIFFFISIYFKVSMIQTSSKMIAMHEMHTTTSFIAFDFMIEFTED